MNLAVDTTTTRDRPTPRGEMTHAPRRTVAWQESLLRLLAVMENGHRGMRSHADRVESVARRVAVEMGLPEEGLLGLQVAALLHDVGKIGLPSSILEKPGRLTAREFEIMKTHAQRGEKILRDVGLPEAACRLVRAHHEQMDGNGYPDGLRGDRIPVEARILAAADAYVALTEDRPCRSALSYRTALDWIATLSGIRFDPEVVQCVLDLHAH